MCEWYYFYGAYGRLLAVYEQKGTEAFDLRLRRRNIYFAGRVTHEWTWQPYGERLVIQDRLGSRRQGLWGISYYPYGEEEGSGEEDDREKFATYWRDSFTGFDYARQRYYVPRSGRFLTPDPYRASAALTNPQTWNRYAYVAGDPVNKVDPLGLLMSPVEDFMRCISTPVGGPWGWSCSGGGGYGWSWGPAYGPQDGGGGGGAGASGVQSPAGLLRKTVAWLMGKLEDEDCARAVGAPSVRRAQTKLRKTKIRFKDLGRLRLAGDKEGGYGFDPESPALAQYVDIFLLSRGINLNTQVNWVDPNQTVALDSKGREVVYPLLDAQAAALGVAGVSPAEFMGLKILHELAHAFGQDHARTGPAVGFDRRIWEECFQ